MPTSSDITVNNLVINKSSESDLESITLQPNQLWATPEDDSSDSSLVMYSDVTTTPNGVNPFDNYYTKSQIDSKLLDASNPNILINSDFSVNQRGQSSYTVSSSKCYTVDRWLMTQDNSVCTVLSNGVRISPATANDYIFYQFIENPQRYAGQTLTFTIKFANNNNELAIRIVDNEGNTKSVHTTDSSGTLSVTRTLGGSITALRCVVNPQVASSTFDILWAKCEIGTNSTSFVPRTYPEELALCQRYYIKLKNNSNYGVFATGGVVYSATKIFLNISLPVTMRVKPTMTASGSLYILSNGTVKTYSSIVVDRLSANTVQTTITASGLTVGQSIGLYVDNDGTAYIDFDAEIY